MNKPLGLTVLYQDMPYPPDQGGKADVWRRIQALRRKGIRVQLIHWIPSGTDSLSAQQKEILLKSVDSLVSFRRRQPFPRMETFFKTPLWMSKFRISDTTFRRLTEQVWEFQPAGIWIEGPWTAEIGKRLSGELTIPLYYRSHNIEHLYMASQAAAENRLARKLWMHLIFFHLRNFETRVMRTSRLVFDISNDDLLWWRGRGIEHNIWLPPISETAFRGLPKVSDQDIDVLFMGNLSSPNNIRGVEWLLHSIWPLVIIQVPSARLTIAGSEPTAKIREEILSTPSVELLANVPDALLLLARAKILVNPVLTGSGIQLKTMEMLSTQAPVVSTSQGVAGFPAWLKDDIAPVNTASGFAERIIEYLKPNAKISEGRRYAQQLFLIDSVDKVVDAISTGILNLASPKRHASKR